MTRQPLTRRQVETLRELRRVHARYGCLPPLSDLARELGYGSPKSVHSALVRLEAAGWISWPQPNGERSRRSTNDILITEDDVSEPLTQRDAPAPVSWGPQGVRIRVDGTYTPADARDVARAILGACRDSENAVERKRLEGKAS